MEKLLITRPRITLAEIAAELKVDKSTVSRDLKAIRQAWAAALSDDDRRALAGRELAALEHVRGEAWVGWAKSLAERRTYLAAEQAVEKHVTAVQEVKGGPDDGAVQLTQTKLPGGETRTQTRTTSEEGLGEPRYLQVALNATAKVIDLLGLAEPARLRVGVEPSDLGALLEALAPFPEARAAAAAALYGEDAEP